VQPGPVAPRLRPARVFGVYWSAKYRQEELRDTLAYRSLVDD
jgi:hypothetical protein